MGPRRYQSPDEDSGRWLGFPFRDGDIVISTRSKSGTTWVQMICALLVFQTPKLPAPLTDLSPWLDWVITPRDEVYARLSAQEHRRFIKTHTPLDGIPLDPRAAFIVIARDPLDIAVSLYHQGDNLDRQRMRQLTGQPVSPLSPARAPLRDWLLAWIDWEGSPQEQLDSLPGVVWHLTDAWARRSDPNVVLVHYDDLSADLEGEMRGLAGRLEIAVVRRPGPSSSMRRASSRCGTVPTHSRPTLLGSSRTRSASSAVVRLARAESCSPVRISIGSALEWNSRSRQISWPGSTGQVRQGPGEGRAPARRRGSC